MFRHTPVLLDSIVEYAPKHMKIVLDCTVGSGGHSQCLLEKYDEFRLYGIDRDTMAIEASQEKLHFFHNRFELFQSCFSELETWLIQWNCHFDYVLADVGVSSEQLARPERGFSFLEEGPLDMRMDRDRQSLTARTLLESSSEQKLCELLKTYGEEPFAAKIAKNLVETRKIQPLERTTQLAELVFKTIPRRFHKKGFHPATKTFQALRIGVNQELNELEMLLKVIPNYMKSRSRLAVISFHSLEDRRVKQVYRNWANPCNCPSDLPYCVCGLTPLGKILTKRPKTATEEEIRDNPRCRSAKLRVFEFNGSLSD